MRRLLFILMAVVSSLIVVSCKDKGPDTAAIAAHAAKGYYDQLLHGDYKAFVEGTYHPERIPDNYREQLETAAKMFMAQQQVDHRGSCYFEADGLYQREKHRRNFRLCRKGGTII